MNAFPFLSGEDTAVGLGKLASGALDVTSGLDFVKLVYQQLFTPVEKDLWTKEVELCV